MLIHKYHWLVTGQEAGTHYTYMYIYVEDKQAILSSRDMHHYNKS